MDQIAEHPELLLQLQQPALWAIMINTLKIQGACMTALIGQPAAPVIPEHDQLLTAKEAAELLGMARLTLLRRRGRTPYCDFVVPTGSRAPRFSMRRIQQYIEQHVGTRAGRAARLKD